METECFKVLSYISIVAGLVAVLALYYASLAVPFDMQSFKGETEPELRYKRRQKMLKWVGLPCVFVSVGCQTAITILRP